MLQTLMNNENFKAFAAHPKVQALLADPEFREVVKTRDFSRILAHPKFASLLQDPEVGPLAAKINPREILRR